MSVAVQYDLSGSTAQAISASVETAIVGGGLGPGDALPPVRRLAGELGVSPNTVAAAYRTLANRGLVIGHGRRGTHVAARPPVTAAPALVVPAGLIDLASGNPDPELLPRLPPLRSEVAAAPAADGLADVDLGDVDGLVQLARHRFAESGLPPGDVLVVGGALDGIERILGARLRGGDRVAVEDPGFPPLVDLLRAMSLVPVPVPVDGRGMVPSSLASALASGAAGVVITPRAQNPTGAALDDDRAGALAEVVAARPGVLVVEDDHAGPVSGADAVSICPLLSDHPWAVVASVSKWLGPDLRVAVMTGDGDTAARVAGRRSVGAGWVSTLLQRLVVDMWSDPVVLGAVRRAANEYTARRSMVVDALAGCGIPAYGRSGLNVWVPLEQEAPAVAACRDAGFAVSAGERFRLTAGPAVRISIAALRAEHVPLIATAIAGAAGRSPTDRRHALAR